jgi:DNA repair protein RecO (recombination protein O)
MSNPQTTDAFILRTVEYGDRDLVVTLFGRSTGKFGAIAKNARGSKKRFGGGLQPIRRLEVAYVEKPNRDLDRLDEIAVADDYGPIQSDYDKITIGSYVTDLVRHVTVEDDPLPQLFDLTAGLFERLADADSSPDVLEILLHHFQLRCLRVLGAAPTLERCFRCGRSAADMEKLRAVRSGEEGDVPARGGRYLKPTSVRIRPGR